MPSIRIVGVYKVKAAEPCHLVEMEVTGLSGQLDLYGITQELTNQPRLNWQVPYDEQYLSMNGKGPLDARDPWSQPQAPDFRLVFFFHYLDFAKPLMTPFGQVELPQPEKKPERLHFVDYEPPG